MTRPTVAILHAPGTNRDGEAARALAAAGAEPTIVLVGEPLRDYAAVCLPGGFSYGDALGAGSRFAFEVADALADVVGRGAPVLGICNGFQVLVRTGLLGATDRDGRRAVTLTHNASGRFECRWVNLVAEPGSRAGLVDAGVSSLHCPAAHGEGRLAVSSPSVAEELTRSGRVLLRYADPFGRPAGGVHPHNPNGSVDDIAGLCDASGDVWGLMPHPEDNVHAVHHPDRAGGPGAASGLRFLAAFVDRAR